MRDEHTTTRRHGGLRTWRRAELAGQWPYALTAVGVGVALPIAVGIPDTDMAFGDHGNEIGVFIAMVAATTGLFLALAAVTGRRVRELTLAGVAIAVAIAHPGIDFVFASMSDNPLGIGRAAVGAMAATIAAVYGVTDHLVGRALRNLTIGVSALAILLHAAASLTGEDHLISSAAMLLAIACLGGGSLAHVRGVRRVDGALIAIGVLTTSAGLGTMLNLIGGRTDLTVGVATLTMVSVMIAAIAGAMAFLDALERHDLGRDAQRLARSLELARLTAQSERTAELRHDQRTALLAIEAAALQLRDHPSDGLAASVAVEAARLQRMLDGASDERGTFAVDGVVGPVVACLATLYEPMTLEIEPDVEAWGMVDETAEVLRALIDNAHEHGVGPVSVQVVAGDDEVIIGVRDCGEGVPDALRHVVFDRGVTSRPDVHSGLGLFAARRLARENGGDVRLSPDDPATFEFVLPVGRPAPTVIDLTDTSTQLHDIGSHNG